jgi:UDP-N-acetylglucosamine 4,6-dehydratase (inverting)
MPSELFLKEKRMNNESVLITGGTGSFGHAFVNQTLEKFNPKKLIIFSRDEMKQWEMAKKYENDSRVRFFIGDVRDKERLMRATVGVDVVIHAAATKIVPTAEYNPFEAIKTNIIGAMNVVDVCIDNGVKRVVALSTDKASSPINLYGATKLVSDKLFVAGNNYSGGGPTKFSVVRYGNVMGSRGSVIPFFLSQKGSASLPITDPEMTRFMITLEQGVELVWTALHDMNGGEIYVKKIPSMKVVDIASTVDPAAKLEIVGIRPGEKIHEQMIGPEDAVNTYDMGDYYMITPQGELSGRQEMKKLANKLVPEGFTYSSENNSDWMSKDELRNWLSENSDGLGRIPLK